MKKLKIILIQIAAITTLIVSMSYSSITTLAQSPLDWQSNAVGLRVSQNENNQTAGLEFRIQIENWPNLMLPGRVVKRNGGLGGPVDIDLGQISVPGFQSAQLSSEETDWAHNELTFNLDENQQLKVWTSRLTPSILIQSQVDNLRLLTGNVKGNRFDGSDVSGLPDGPAYPKYVAYSTGGTLKVEALNSIPITLPALDQGWLLLWYGNNSHFVSTKRPMSYFHWNVDDTRLPVDSAYQADAPLLVVFENQPATIRQADEGGVDISFTASAGYVTLLPLFGRNHPYAGDTEDWAQGLPAEVVQKTAWWANHLCHYPVTARETYSYNQTTDTATITENITFLPVCEGGTSLAPIPPFLSLVKDSLGVVFSGPVVDGNLATQFGPIMGIENTSQYSWSVTGLKKYTDAISSPGSGQVPLDLKQDIEAHVQRIINSGHFAPWIFMDGIPRHRSRGDLYWANPADGMYHLIEIAEALPEGSLKTNLINYIKSERMAYPPEDVYDLEVDPNHGAGTIRQPYSYYGGDWKYYWDGPGRADVHLQDVPLYNYYALARYHQLTAEPLPLDLIDKAKIVLERDMSEQDWATFYWFSGFQDRPVAVINANRHFAGLIGFIRLAEIHGDSNAESLGRTLLAKAAVMRLAMGHFPRYLYAANLIDLPADPDWQPKYTVGFVHGYLYNYDWDDPSDDIRQIRRLDQFGMHLLENEPGSSPYLIAFRDLTPELARFLGDYAQEEVTTYIQKVETLFPHWYAAFAEGMLGYEHNLSHPIDSYQIFLAKAWIQNETANQLEQYVDIPWIEAGDLFYVHKLAESIKAYRGDYWLTQ